MQENRSAKRFVKYIIYCTYYIDFFQRTSTTIEIKNKAQKTEVLKGLSFCYTVC